MTWKNDQITEQDTQKILELAKSALQIEGDFVDSVAIRATPLYYLQNCL